jgi:hypothetical protein
VDQVVTGFPRGHNGEFLNWSNRFGNGGGNRDGFGLIGSWCLHFAAISRAGGKEQSTHTKDCGCATQLLQKTCHK